MLLNFRKSKVSLTCMASLTFFFFFYIYFFQFHHSILDWLKIEFHNLFRSVFYNVTVVLKNSLNIGSALNFAIVYFCYHIVK